MSQCQINQSHLVLNGGHVASDADVAAAGVYEHCVIAAHVGAGRCFSFWPGTGPYTNIVTAAAPPWFGPVQAQLNGMQAQLDGIERTLAKVCSLSFD